MHIDYTNQNDLFNSFYIFSNTINTLIEYTVSL